MASPVFDSSAGNQGELSAAVAVVWSGSDCDDGGDDEGEGRGSGDGMVAPKWTL